MVNFVRHASAMALALTVFGAAPGAHAADCHQPAMTKLQTSAPDGWSIYQQIVDKHFFRSWLDCGDAQFGLPTAVHESTHDITSERDAFPLVGGGEVARPHQVSKFYPPAAIAKIFPASDFVTTYLKPGAASSSGDMLYLLDELNAYSHDLNAAVDLRDLHTADAKEDHRDGLAALMAFVAVYIHTAETSHPETWKGLQEPQVAQTVATLWDHAEHVMASSCGIPDFGTEDRGYIQQFCGRTVQASLRTIIGRQPVCPVACLGTTSSNGQNLDDKQASR